MASLSICDMCREYLKPSDKKFLFAYYPVTEEDEETNKQRFEELVKALYDGKRNAETSIHILEVCTGCAGVFAHFMNLRKKELIRSRREVGKMLRRKVRAEAKKKDKKEKKNG